MQYEHNKVTARHIDFLYKRRTFGYDTLQARSNPSDELCSDERAADAIGNAQLEGGFQEGGFSGCGVAVVTTPKSHTTLDTRNKIQ